MQMLPLTMIGGHSALEPLIALFDEGDDFAVKEAAFTIYNLCLMPINNVRAVRDGAVRVSIKRINEGGIVNHALFILLMVANNPNAIEQIMEHGGISCLFETIRNTPSSRIRILVFPSYTRFAVVILPRGGRWNTNKGCI